MSIRKPSKKRALIAAAVFGVVMLKPHIALAQEDGAVSQSGQDVCEEASASEWFEAEWVCERDGRGLAIALPNQAAQLANALDGAVVDFEGYFAPSRYNFAVVGTPSLPQEASAFLKERGFLTLPWITKASRGNLLKASVERQVNAQTKGMSEEARAAILAQALKQLGDVGPGNTQPPSATELGALAHEAGHGLFQYYFDDGALQEKSVTRYGSSAPDWIDELAAILNENETLTQARYKAARARIDEGERPNPFALSEFLEMEHPSLRAAQAVRERSGVKGDNVAIVLSGEEAEQFLKESGGNPAEFYLQARLFADFLLEATGDERIFAKISNGLKDDGSFEAWLERNHTKLGLAGEIGGLEAQWNAWIEQRFATDAGD